MSELMEASLAFGELVQEMRERSRHLDSIYANIMIDLATSDVEESDLEHGDVYIDVDDTSSPPILQRFDEDTVSVNDNNRVSQSNDPPILQRFDEDTVSDNGINRDTQSNEPPVIQRFDTYDYELIEIVSASSSDYDIDEPWVRQDIADDAQENDEVLSMSSHDSDSGFGDADSIISSVSEFSSITAELRYNEESHFGYIVAQEHVAPPTVVNESWRHAHSLAVSDWVEEIDEFVYACAYARDNADGFTFGHTSVETDKGPVRECSSDTCIARDRKRKRDDPNDVMKSTSDIDCSYKKRKLLGF